MSREDLPPSRTAEQFVVRFPDGMRDRIAEAAKVAGRSMNAEIVARLQSTFKPEQQALDFGSLSNDIQGLREEMQTHQQMIESLIKRGADVKFDDKGHVESISLQIPAEAIQAKFGKKKR